MQLLITINDRRVLKAGTIIIGPVNSKMFDKGDPNAAVLLTPGFEVTEPANNSDAWLSIEFVAQDAPGKTLPFKTKTKKGKK